MNEEVEHPAQSVNAHRAVIVFSVAFVISLLCYYRFMQMFFIFDDLPLLRRSSPDLGNSITTILRPMDNGFWRPLHTIMALIIEKLFDKRPFAFHMIGIVIHTVNSLLVYLVARVVYRISFEPSVWASIFCAAHIGGYLAVIHPGNYSDLTLATAFLLGVLGWHLIHREDRALGWIIFVSSIIIGFTSKETYVVMPGVLLLLEIGKGKHPLQILRKPLFVFLIGISILYTVLVIALQVTWSHSYSSGGKILISPSSNLRMFADYYISLLIPYIHVLEFPFHHIHLPGAILWIFRLVVIGGLGYFAYRLVKGRRKYRAAFSLLLVPALIFTPVSILDFLTQSRFLYSAIPFFALGLILLSCEIDIKPHVRALLGTIFVLFHVIGFYWSATPTHLLDVASKVEKLVNELRNRSSEWNDDYKIAILHHPHKAQEPHNWVYRQLIFDVFLDGQYLYISDEQSKAADRVYTVTEDGLREMEDPPNQ